MEQLNFTALGKPKPLKRHRDNNHGGKYDPSAGDKLAWLALIAHHKPDAPFDEPIAISINFYMPRPKSHYYYGKRSDVLREGVPNFHTNTPDLDNLLKFICDSMNKVFYKDDSCISGFYAWKLYSDNPRTEVSIRYDLEGSEL